MSGAASDNPAEGAERPAGGDGAHGPVTSGAPGVMTGVVRNWRIWAVILPLLVFNGFVNVMSGAEDTRRLGVPFPVWRLTLQEVTSAAAAIIAAAAIVAALRIAPPGRGPLWRTIAVHLAGSVAFSLLHVSLMTLFRLAAFGAVGLHYRFGIEEFPYEYRKDVISYVVLGGTIWFLSRREPPTAQAAADAAGRATFDIRDGASILRTPIADILAVQAAGNYVEFALADGRRPLMRASMAAIEKELGAAGFLRTHRSWLVNETKVRALTPAGSGDFRVDLGVSVTAPVSRRYPAALARLKGEPAG